LHSGHSCSLALSIGFFISSFHAASVGDLPSIHQISSGCGWVTAAPNPPYELVCIRLIWIRGSFPSIKRATVAYHRPIHRHRSVTESVALPPGPLERQHAVISKSSYRRTAVLPEVRYEHDSCWRPPPGSKEPDIRVFALWTCRQAYRGTACRSIVSKAASGPGWVSPTVPRGAGPDDKLRRNPAFSASGKIVGYGCAQPHLRAAVSRVPACFDP
jgi:hypothetical protein